MQVPANVEVSLHNMFVKILVACLISSAIAVVDWRGTRDACLTSVNASDPFLLQEPEKKPCFDFCMYQQYGLMGDSGDFSITYLKAKIPNFLDEGLGLALMCQMIHKEKDVCERATKRRKCLTMNYDLCL